MIGGCDGASELNRQRELQQRMDIDDNDIVIQGSTTTRISRKQVNHLIFFLSSILYLSLHVQNFLFYNVINFFFLNLIYLIFYIFVYIFTFCYLG